MAVEIRPRGLVRRSLVRRSLVRRGAIVLGVGTALTTVAVICAAIWRTQPLGDYTSVSSPLTASVDIVTGVPSCNAIGPAGMIDDGASLYFSDWCTGLTYKYDLDTPALAREVNSAPDGLTGGLALDNGRYYGIASTGKFAVPPGIYSFNPADLALQRQVGAAPCAGPQGLTGLAADPVTGDLYVTAWCGLWRISGVDGPAPVMRRLAAGEFDGIAVADSGRAVWVAGIAHKNVIEYSSTGTEIAAVAVPDSPVGVALVAPTVRSPVAGDLFTSDDDGSISMVDTHDGDKVSVVASGGNRGEYLTIGPDGYMYVAKADRVEQVQPAIFGPITIRSRAGQGAPSAVALSARAHMSALEAGLPLIATFAAIATVLILVAGLVVYRRRREPRVTSPEPEPVATPSAPEDQDSIRRRLLTDPNVLPSGTTLRLAVLVLMIIASTGSIYTHLSVVAHSGSDITARSCLGSFVVPGGAQPVGPAVTVLGCLHRYTLPIAIWSMSGIAAVLVATALVYALTPWWLIRFTRPWGPWPFRDARSGRRKVRRPWWVPGPRQRLRELQAYKELGEEVGEAITALACRVGLTGKLRVKVEPYSNHADARAFGYQRRGYLRLDHGLIRQFRANRRAFDAVVLHELGHLRNRDNRPTYVTYAAWRVFAALALLPYAVSLIAPDVIGHPLDSRAYRLGGRSFDPRIAATVPVMAALVYLTSRAVFRVRETHADAAAAQHDNGALDELFAVHQRLAEGKRQIPDFLTHHPGWERRRSDLKDPRRLAAPDPLAMFAAGVAISMIAVNVWFAVGVGSLASWLSPGKLVTILREVNAGHQGIYVLLSLAIVGPGTLIALTAIAGFACTVAWRAQLGALPWNGLPGDGLPGDGLPGDGGGAPVLRTAIALVAGMMLGEPMSAIYADGGTWGVFDSSTPWGLADVAASAAALALIVVTVFRWAQESAAVCIPVTRISLRRARAVTAGVGMLGAAPALFVWSLAHNTVNITSFGYQSPPAAISSWFGARWAYADYYPLTYLVALPGAAALFAVPCLYLAARAARQNSPWPRVKTVLTAGLAAAALTELLGFLLAIAERWILGGPALAGAFELGGNAAYLPLAWMTWTGASACAVTSVVLFRKSGRFALTSALLVSFICSSAAAVLLLAPLFVGYCGTRAFWCASIEPHDLLSAYGIMASEIPIYAAILAILFLLIARMCTYSFARFRAGMRPAPAHAAPARAAPVRPFKPPRPAYQQAVLLLVLLNSLGGAVIYFTQVFTW